MSRIRIKNQRGDAVSNAIKKAEDAAYQRGFEEASAMHDNLNAEGIKERDARINELTVSYAKLDMEKESMENSFKVSSQGYEATIKELRKQIVTVGDQNRELKETLVEKNRTLTKQRQKKASAVTGTMTRRQRRSMRHRMKEEDDEFYG